MTELSSKVPSRFSRGMRLSSSATKSPQLAAPLIPDQSDVAHHAQHVAHAVSDHRHSYLVSTYFKWTPSCGRDLDPKRCREMSAYDLGESPRARRSILVTSPQNACLRDHERFERTALGAACIIAGVFCDRLAFGQSMVQSSTRRPSTRANSPTLLVMTVNFLAFACPAIKTS